MEERERRKRNVVIKGLEKGKRDLREEIRRLREEMGVQAEIEEIREVNKRRR